MPTRVERRSALLLMRTVGEKVQRPNVSWLLGRHLQLKCQAEEHGGRGEDDGPDRARESVVAADPRQLGSPKRDASPGTEMAMKDVTPLRSMNLRKTKQQSTFSTAEETRQP